MNSKIFSLALILFAPLLFSACGGSSDKAPPQYGSIRILNALEDDTPIVVKTLSDCWKLGYNDAGSNAVSVRSGNQRQITIYPWREDATVCSDYTNAALTTYIDITPNTTYHFAVAGNKESAELFPIILAEDPEPDGIFIVNMMNLVESKKQLNLYIVNEGDEVDFENPDTQLDYGETTGPLSFEQTTAFKIVLTDTANADNSIIFDSGALSPYESSGVSWLILPYENFAHSEYDVTAALYTGAGITLWTEKSRVRFASLYGDESGYPEVKLYIGDATKKKACEEDEDTGVAPDECICHVDTPEFCTLDDEVDKFVTQLAYGEASEYILGDNKHWTLKFTKTVNVDEEQQELVFYEQGISTSEGSAYTSTLVSLKDDSEEEIIYAPNALFIEDEQRSYDDYGTVAITNNFFASQFVTMEIIKEGENEAEEKLTFPSINYWSVIRPVLTNGNYRIQFTPGSSSDSPSQEELDASAYDISVNSDNQSLYISVNETDPQVSRWISLD